MIPRLIQLHRFWDDKQFPITDTAKMYHGLLGDGVTMLMLREIPSEFMGQYSALVERKDLEPRMLADAVRYWCLYRYGGVYVDADTRPLRSFDSLFAMDGPFVAGVDMGEPYFCLAGGPQGDPVWIDCLDHCLGLAERGRNYQIGHMRGILAQHNVTILGGNSVAEVYPSHRPTVDAYVMHYRQSVYSDEDTKRDDRAAELKARKSAKVEAPLPKGPCKTCRGL